MFCSSSSNSGFIEIIGPIKQQDIHEVNEYPLSIAFAPRSTIPCLLKNIIDENSDNTCTYKGRRYNLVSGQICRVVNKGYILPGQNNIPKAELILSFTANTGEEKISGILLCIPIYDSGTPNHDAYLNQIIEQDDQLNCNKELKNTTVPTLESIFYGWEGDTTQTSIAYKTCFELMGNDTSSSKELYIVVFPNGITLTSARYQKLLSLIKINDDIPMYFIPPVIRNGEPTLSSYTTNSNGDKVSENNSSIGNIYTTSISSCDDEFKHKFVFYIRPPRSSSKAALWNSEQCPYYKTSEYKCVPFNQVKDLSGNLVVPGKKTLDTILSEKNEAKSNNTISISTNSISTEQIIEIIAGVGGIALLAIIGLKVGSAISNSG